MGRARAQAAQVGVAQAAWLPNLDGRLGASRLQNDQRYYNSNSAVLTLSWLVFDSGARSANGENARQLLEAAAADAGCHRAVAFLSALQAFYTAQATQAAVVSTTEAERAAREGFAAAESRYKVGVATPADRLLAQTALSQATLNRIKAEGEARNALGTLANAMGFQAGQTLTLAPPPAVLPDAAFHAGDRGADRRGRSRRPDLKAAEAQVKAAQAGVDLARAQGRPTVSVSTGPTWAETDRVSVNGGIIGVTVNLPLFTGFDTTYRVRAAEAQVDVREAQRDRLGTRSRSMSGRLTRA